MSWKHTIRHSVSHDSLDLHVFVIDDEWVGLVEGSTTYKVYQEEGDNGLILWRDAVINIASNNRLDESDAIEIVAKFSPGLNMLLSPYTWE